MNMKKHIAIVLFGSCCVIASRTYALTACDTNNYFTAVDKVIDSAIKGNPDVALTIFPSFESEYGVRIVQDNVYLVQLRTSFWGSSIVSDRPGSYHHDFSVPRVKTAVYKAALTQEVSNQVKRMYSSVLAKDKNKKTGGLDGTTYRFVLQSGGCGETWSPSENSIDNEFVKLGELLAAHARSTRVFRSFSENRILRKLAEIEQRNVKK